MDTFTTLLVVAYSASIHATFQLSLSVLTLFSGHSFGQKKSKTRLIQLTSYYIGGVGLMSILLSASLVFFFTNIFGSSAPTIVWAVLCGISVGLGISVWLYYYNRHSDGTELWMPRQVAKYLHNRIKKTKSTSESFGLGLMSGLGEILFTFVPLFISALLIVSLSPNLQLAGIFIYLAISILPLLIIWVLIVSGYKISTIQIWRTENKWFLQFISGSSLILIGLYLFVNIVYYSASFGNYLFGVSP